jgi:hypothetical protein
MPRQRAIIRRRNGAALLEGRARVCGSLPGSTAWPARATVGQDTARARTRQTIAEPIRTTNTAGEDSREGIDDLLVGCGVDQPGLAVAVAS